jgi:threonine dehydrogenase-like Zn-dependent dehydrogenase
MQFPAGYSKATSDRGIAHESSRMARTRCETVPDPQIEHPRDAIIDVTARAVCRSDPHIRDGVIPSTQHGDVLGHETIGEIVEVAPGSPVRVHAPVTDGLRQSRPRHQRDRTTRTGAPGSPPVKCKSTSAE